MKTRQFLVGCTTGMAILYFLLFYSWEECTTSPSTVDVTVRPPKRSDSIGLLVPLTSHDFSVFEKQMDTFLTNTNLGSYSFTFFVGYTENHPLMNIDNLTRFRSRISTKMSQGSGRISWILSRWPSSFNPTRISAELARLAVENDMDYVYTITESTQHKSAHWPDTFISQLFNSDIANMGITGAKDENGILSNIFVHNSHYHFFGYLYPPSVTSDVQAMHWITSVYGPQFTFDHHNIEETKELNAEISAAKERWNRWRDDSSFAFVTTEYIPEVAKIWTELINPRVIVLNPNAGNSSHFTITAATRATELLYLTPAKYFAFIKPNVVVHPNFTASVHHVDASCKSSKSDFLIVGSLTGKTSPGETYSLWDAVTEVTPQIYVVKRAFLAKIGSSLSLEAFCMHSFGSSLFEMSHKYKAAQVDGSLGLFPLQMEIEAKNSMECDSTRIRELMRNIPWKLTYSRKHDCFLTQAAESYALEWSADHISVHKNAHAGERCVVMGNGPSLNKMDLSFLKREVVFSANKIYLGFERFNFTPSYYCAVNELVLQQSVKKIVEMGSVRFVPSKKGFPYQLGIQFLQKSGEKKFWNDGLHITEGWTVTYAMLQLAYFVGCHETVLIGVDHTFDQKGKPNEKQKSNGPDPNHFDPNYFGKGTEWQLADLKNSEKHYAIARDYYEQNGRKIIDATLEGKCQVFEKADYKEVFF